LISRSAVNGNIAMAEGSRIDLEGPSATDGWQVPARAVAPTAVQGQGLVANTNPVQRWNDSLTVGSIVRRASVSCTQQSAADTHCSAATPGAYGAGARLNLVQLFGFDVDDTLWMSGNALFKPQLP
jgi:hypothetical protein